MLKKMFAYIKDTIKEEYKFIIILLLLYIILQFPLNYYITIGGGMSDISKRIEVEDKYESKGSFNLCYVEQLKGNIMTYLMSYIIPTWERESTNDYKYNVEESIEDIEFRGDLDLKTANATATYWAYILANKKINQISSKLYVIATFEGYETTLKVQDEVLSIDGNSYDTINEYKEYLQTKTEEDTVVVKIIRNKKEREITAKLYNSDGNTILGVGLQYVKEYKTDPKVKIKFKSDESGPSAGLMTTLEIYNQLTKKDITHGLTIAGTGTIEVDGTIGMIGGVEHKLLGAASTKADIFLVPSGQNYKDALKYKKDKNLDIEIVEVSTIEDALNKLEDLK